MPVPHATPTGSGSPRRAEVAYWACADGGGTGTRVRLHAAASAETIGFGQGGPSALGQGSTQAWRHIREALNAACTDAGIAPVQPGQVALGLGLSGAEVAPWRTEFIGADPGFAACVLESDAVAQLLGAHGGGPGLVVIGGTGSVALQRTREGAVHGAGGWGFGLGDEGSGAWLGQRALQHLTQVLDGRAAADTLSSLLAPAVGHDRTAIIDWSRKAGQEGHGRLAPLVFSAAEQGDAVAARLLQQAGDELAALVRALDRHQAALPIVVSGSVAQRLWARWPADLRARVVSSQGDALDGALALLRESAIGAVAADKGSR